jgi:hypothetical protein
VIFGGTALVYPFVGVVLHGHEDSFAYSAGFFYGTLFLAVLLSEAGFSSDEALFVSVIIAALACWIIFLKRKNNQ